MMHVVFNEPDIDVMSKAIALDDSLIGEIIIVRDDYALGPLNDIYTAEGADIRLDWWHAVLLGGDYNNLIAESKVNDALAVETIKKKLDEDNNEVLWIWAAQNKHDVCGYYWLMSQLQAYQGRIYILYLNNLPFINEKGHIFYPNWLSQILPREFIKAKKLARIISSSEFEVDADEWNKICTESKLIRLLEGGKKLVQKEINFYDAGLIQYITHDYQKAHKIIHQFISKNKETTGDAFLLWRLKYILQDESSYEVLGEIKSMKDFEIRKSSEANALA
jgi:hypothetical protein